MSAITNSVSTVLILGGARSGKSRLAQQIAENAHPQRLFIATAEDLDNEMSERISRHQADRGNGWQTVESPIALCGALRQAGEQKQSVLVDCLTLWLSNIMHAQMNIDAEIERLASTVEAVSTPLILVSNEVGMGIVPATPLGREFRDAQGRLNQRMGKACNRVEFIAAGLPLRLKG